MSAHRLGYVSSSRILDLGASHTCRLAGLTSARVEALVAENLSELEQLLLFNEAHGIELFRINSSIVPLASHPANRAPWWRTFARDFQHLGKIATRSRQRLSMHPSPAGASLASARAEVRAATLEELRYSHRVLDLLGQDRHGVVVVHVGGAAPDRPTALAAANRFLDAMPAELKSRMAVEHDDRTWSAREVFPLAFEHGLPFLADTLHNAVLPSTPRLSTRELFRLADRSWSALGLRPKHHLASQRPGGPPGAHADRIDPADFLAALEALERPADLMLEAKDKDLALFALADLPAAPTARG
jgi:UV DNA damage endonuclease